MSVDISKIKAGDLVRAQYLSSEMRDAGIPPAPLGENGWAVAYAPFVDTGRIYVAGHAITIPQITVLESHPEWTNVMVIQSSRLGPLVRRISGGGFIDSLGALRTLDFLEGDDITVVLDADGNPPRPKLDSQAKDFAWAGYRKEYALDSVDGIVAHKAFRAGWEAAVLAIIKESRRA